MSSLYLRGKRIYFRLKVDGVWKGLPTDYLKGQERQARVALDKLEQRLAAGDAVGGELGPVTVKRFYTHSWLPERKATISTWANDEGTFRLHVLPAIGHLRVDEVRPLHMKSLAAAWRRALAPKSVYNAYSSVSAFFRDACLADLISVSPCILTKHQLGPKTDKNPEWRPTAQFSRVELERLITDPLVPWDRRVLYSLEGIGALRHGEAAGLHWRNCGVQPAMEPLGMLYVAYSYRKPVKGNYARAMPIHPTLAGILAEWRLHGWPAMFGRKPTPDDLVLPLPPGTKSKTAPYRSKGYSFDRFEQDLAKLELRHRRGHDLRRTMISLARSDGAVKDILRRGTHKAPKEVIEGYTTFEWDVLCREVSKLSIQRRSDAEVVSLPKAASAGGDSFATGLATLRGEAPMIVTETAMALPGLEAGREAAVYDEPSLVSTAPFDNSRGCESASPADTSVEVEESAEPCSNVAREYEARGLAAGFRLVRGGGQ